MCRRGGGKATERPVYPEPFLRLNRSTSVVSVDRNLSVMLDNLTAGYDPVTSTKVRQMDGRERSGVVETRGGSVRLRVGRALVATLIPVFATVWLLVPPAEAATLSTQVATATQPMGNAPGTASSATVPCPSGTVLIGGGVQIGRATDTATPGNGLKVNGTMPSDSAGNPVANGATDPSFWTAVGGFGGQSEAGDQVTSFAMCSTGGPAHTTVATASVSGVALQGSPPLIATATCPSGTSLVGGGALGTPP